MRDADFAECPRCGIVIAKFQRAHDEPHESAVDLSGVLHATSAPTTRSNDSALRPELIARATALPFALLVARIAVKTSPGLVRLFTMWVHESGHATAAWLCGYPAWPGPWFTPVASERSPLFSVMLMGAMAYGGYRAWQVQRWFWVVASAGTLLMTLFCTVVVGPVKAHQLIIFGGDAGCMVLGTVLMLTMYARRDHPVRENHLRWALLLIGALAFMDAYIVWSGPIDGLPFGENENGLSDPSVLTEIYGWNVLRLINRYGELAHACLAVLAIVYVTMLLLERRDSRSFESSSGSVRRLTAGAR
ncbi:MAG: hypothetical protein ACRD1V_16650 [Vicinamibacterales bacterium]